MHQPVGMSTPTNALLRLFDPFPLFLYPLQQNRSGFVVRVLGDEFAATCTASRFSPVPVSIVGIIGLEICNHAAIERHLIYGRHDIARQLELVALRDSNSAYFFAKRTLSSFYAAPLLTVLLRSRASSILVMPVISILLSLLPH